MTKWVIIFVIQLLMWFWILAYVWNFILPTGWITEWYGFPALMTMVTIIVSSSALCVWQDFKEISPPKGKK